MPKILNVLFPEKCIGCELCVIESQKQLDKVGLDGSLIRIFKNRNSETKQLTFSIELDPKVNELDIKKISQVCPTATFSIEDKDYQNELIN